MNVPRRHLLLGGSALLAATACAPSSEPSATAETSAVSPTPGSTTTSSASPSPTPPPSSETASPAPSRQQIIDQFQDQEPSQWGMEMEGIVSKGTSVVALTLDACGGPKGSGVDHRILDTLRTHQIPATLFLNQRWIDANPDLTQELADDELFEIGNHGTRHVPLSVTGASAYDLPGTADVGEAYDEVMGNHATLSEILGSAPRLFRSGTAHYDDIAVAIVQALGETPIGFTVNADGGATLSASATARQLLTAQRGDIILGHMNRPDHEAGQGYVDALPQLLDQGVTFARVSDILQF